MTPLALPSRRDEAFRYADLAALERVWPVAPERIAVAPGEAAAHAIVMDAPNDQAREIEVELGAGARLDLRLLNAGGAYGRFALTVTLAERADFHFVFARNIGFSPLRQG